MPTRSIVDGSPDPITVSVPVSAPLARLAVRLPLDRNSVGALASYRRAAWTGLAASTLVAILSLSGLIYLIRHFGDHHPEWLYGFVVLPMAIMVLVIISTLRSLRVRPSWYPHSLAKEWIVISGVNRAAAEDLIVINESGAVILMES
jgi:hypothetical protein